MTQNKQSKKLEIKDIFTRQFFSRHFTPIMCFFAVAGFFLIVVSSLVNNPIMMSISTTLFSAATLGVIFKVLGYDVFILTVVRQIIFERKFLELLREDEQRAIVRETIAVIRGLPPKEETYEVFEKYLLDELVGITNDNRRFFITLQHHTIAGHKVMLGEVTTTYEAFNESPKPQPLFCVEGEEGVIFKGDVTIPECLKGIPSASIGPPTAVWDLQKNTEGTYAGVFIDGRLVDCEKKVEYLASNDPSKGISYKIKVHETIEPTPKPKTIELRYQCVYDTHDYIVRTLGRYGKDLEVIVNKPEDVEVYVSWFLTALGKEPKARKEGPQKSSTSYVQKIQGVLVPGNGFVVMWWPREKGASKRKKEEGVTSGSS